MNVDQRRRGRRKRGLATFPRAPLRQRPTCHTAPEAPPGLQWRPEKAACPLFLAALASALALPLAAQGQDAAKPPTVGLYVQAGTLMRAGRPVRAFGVNYFNALARAIQDPADTSYAAGLAVLGKHNVPVIRFMAGGFWPKDCALYRADPKEYFRRFDAFVAEARRQGIGLIPSLFWHFPTAGDLVGEPMDQLGNPRSKTHAYMRQYVADVVGRYKHSPAVWAWEVGNEYNLSADLPNAAAHRPKIVPQLGTPRARTARDELTSAAMRTFLTACAKEIRKHDAHRVILSGNSLPRPSAHHNSAERSWKADTRAQFRQVLLRDNPAPIDVLSIHVYPHAAKGRFADAPADLPALLAAAQEAGKSAGKPLIVGEFGIPRDPKNPRQERKDFAALVAALETSRAPLALLWVFDLPHQNNDWSVTGDNDRAHQLRTLADANRRLAKSAD